MGVRNADFDTPMERRRCTIPGFYALICVNPDILRVLFTCCRSVAGSFLWLVSVWLVWWWFENSRACLYYFIVNTIASSFLA
ncbi:MAG: hypothetical protein R3C44_00115 [Chloroflexota bacterium]